MTVLTCLDYFNKKNINNKQVFYIFVRKLNYQEPIYA